MINDLDETTGPLGFTAEMVTADAPAEERHPYLGRVARYTEAMGILLTEEQDRWLKAHAVERGVSAGAVVRWALERYRDELPST
jgi:hypothetical protein